MERRTFLVLGAAAVGLAGCTSDASDLGPPSAPATTAAPRDPDARIREEVAAAEVALIAAYRSAIEANPELAAELVPFLAQHEAHLARVAPGFVSDVAAPVGSASASSSASASGPPQAGASSALAELAAAESAAQAQRATACDAAQYPGLARDLCLIAASEAQHAAALDDLSARGSGS